VRVPSSYSMARPQHQHFSPLLPLSLAYLSFVQLSIPNYFNLEIGVCPAWVRFPPYLKCKNSSQFQPRGEFAWEHIPVHVVQESKPGMVIRTAESDRPRVKDPHDQDPVSRSRDLHGAIGGATMRLHHKKRCSHMFTDSQTHVP